MNPIIYEPRAFWSVASVDASGAGEQLVELDKAHLYNGQQWPITITEIGIAPIKYGLSVGSYGLAGSPGAEAVALEGIRVGFSARHRYDFSQSEVCVGGFVNQATQPLSGQRNASNIRPSSAHGVVVERFDRPMVMPWNGVLEFALSTWLSVSPNGFPGDLYPYPTFSVLFSELGGQMKGQGRSFNDRTLRDLDHSGAPNLAGWLSNLPSGLGALQIGAQAVSTPFPPQHVIPPKEWLAQSPARGSRMPSTFTGWAVLIDQIGYDDDVIATPLDANSTMAMLANQVGVRARTTEGGTKQDWWRPGMPLSLCGSHITPAVFHKLEQPFTMEPGEQLEAFLRIPTLQNDISFPYQIAVAFKGFASIEGLRA